MLRRFAIPLVVLLVLAVGAVALRRPVGGVVRNWRFDSNLAKAEEALAEGDLGNANRLTSAAWRLKRTDLEAVRELLALAEKIRSPELLQMALVRFSHPEATTEDQAAVLELGLRQGDLGFVEGLHASLSEERRRDPLVRLCHAEVLERTGHTLEAVEEIRDLGKNAEQASAARLRLTRMLPRLVGNPVARQEVRLLVREMISSADRNALEAFRNLSLLPAEERDLGGDRDLQAWLDQQPGAKFADRLLATEIEISGATSEQRHETIERLVAKHAAEHPEEMARWLLKLGEREQILNLPREALRRDEILYTAYLQVLIDLERYEDTRKWLARPHPKLDAVLLESVRAGLSLKEGDDPGRVAHWQRAMEKARFANRYGTFLAMMRIAERFGDTDMALKVCRTIAGLPARILPPTRELSFLDLAMGDDPAFLAELHQRIVATRPNDPLARFNQALVQVLRGEEVESSALTLEELAHRFPKALSFQCAQALLHLGRGDGKLALELLESQQADWEKSASDFEKSVYVLVLRDQGLDRAARVLEDSINASRLPAYQRKWLVAKGVGKSW